MSSGTDLGFHMETLPTVIKNTREKFKDVQTKVQVAFASFVTASNPEWYAKNAKKFFQDVGKYVDDLNKDIKDTGDSFIKSLNSAGEGWHKVTGNDFKKDTTPVEKIKGSAEKADNYQDNKGGQVFMTESCEANVTSNFEKFATEVQNQLNEVKNVLNKGELIGGDQSEGFMNVIGQIATKFQTKIAEQKAELKKALAESRKAYVEFASKVASTTLSE